MDRPYRHWRMSRRSRREMIMYNMHENSSDEQALPRHANAALTDLIMQMNKPNMRIEQTKGQRRYGPPTDHVGPPPPKGCEIFVGKIPNTVFELELVPIFEKVGKVYDIRMLMNLRFVSGRNRGFGYVRYYSPEEADDAVFILNNYEIRQNIHLAVTKSVDNYRLYMTNIPHQINEDEILKELYRLGVAGMTRVIAISGGEGCGGVAFIDFENHAKASIARRTMMMGEIRIWKNIVNGEWALPEPETDILFVRNLTETTTGNQLMELFNSGNGVGWIIKMETTAYVRFHTPAHAERARCALDNSTLDGHRIDVLAIHGDEELMPNEPYNAEINQRFSDPHESLCKIPGCQQLQVTGQPFATVPTGFPAPLKNFNPSHQFPVFGFPGFLPFVPGMMSMSSKPSGQNCENQKCTDDDKPDNLIDLEQVEE